MSYTVIARRYRPQTFDEVIGQVAIATTLQNSIKADKVSHAYIFAGERGVGKTSMARILAKALNCKDGPTASPCNKCEFCKSIAEGNDPDVIEIDAASRTKVDDVRSLQEGIGYMPMRAKFKIYIMDEAHQLSKNAFDALLKTIEEPPPHVKFIFATTVPHKLPDTILSRCQRFNFRRISPQDIFTHLEKICKKEKVVCDKETISIIAQHANGSMRDAETILDQIISYGDGKVSPGDIEQLLGKVSLNEIISLTDAIYNKNFTGIIEIIDEAFNQGKDIELFFDQSIEHFWRLILINSNPPGSPIVEREIVQEKAKYEAQAKKFTVETMLQYIQILSEARWRLKETTNTRVFTELTLLRIANLLHGTKTESAKLPVQPNESVGKKKSVTEENKPVIAEPKPTFTSPEPEPETHSVNLEEIGGLWSKIMLEISNTNKKIHAYLKESQFVSADNNEIMIGFPPQASFHRKMIDDEKNRKLIEDEIYKITGRNLSIVTKILNAQNKVKRDNPGNDTTDTSNQNNATSKDDVINSLLSNPIIKRVQEEFDGRIIKVENKGEEK
jgi:DNA polymerase-3 subunit gamma/tau